MQLDYQLPGGETIRQRLERDARAITTLLQDDRIDDLVFERLPSGELAWLRPSADNAEADDALYWPTQAGRRAIAMEALFGQPWPRVSETLR